MQRFKPSDTLKLAQGLFYLDAVTWLVLGGFSLARMSANAWGISPIAALVVTVLMFGNAAAMLLSGVLLGRPNRWFYLFALAVLLVNIVLTFTDQFGALDLITLLIDLALLVILILLRGRYFARNSTDQ